VRSAANWTCETKSSVARAVDQASSRLGGIDMLVNNAGIGMRTVNPRFMTHPQGFWEVPADGFRAMIETNLTGYFLVAREVTPRMLAAGGGRIVNISVNNSTMHRAGFVPYGPPRAGSEALSRIMAADAAGVHDERIVAAEFDRWLRDRTGRR
jgi:NAD(P)-dependent dehydrogenase (short-subunit alcohol dehydrogenase family)